MPRKRKTIKDPSQVDALIDGYRQHAAAVERIPIQIRKHYAVCLVELAAGQTAADLETAAKANSITAAAIDVIADYKAPNVIPANTELQALVVTRINLQRTLPPAPPTPPTR